MARTPIAEHKVTRGDVFRMHPDDIVVDEKLRGRSKPPTISEIQEKVDSLQAYGQLQPVTGRYMPGGEKVQLIAGFTRHAAAKKIVEKLNPDFRLKVLITTCSDLEAIQLNVVENNDRKATSAIDDAMNIRRLEEHGQSAEQIGKLYHHSKAWVSDRLKLLLLADPIRDAVHEGHLAPTPALLLTQKTHKDQLRIWNNVWIDFRTKGISPTEQIKKILRDQQAEAEEADDAAEDPAVAAMETGTPGGAPVAEQPKASEPAPKVAPMGAAPTKKIPRPKALSRSVKEVRTFMEGLDGPAYEEGVRDLVRTLVAFMAGTVTEKNMEELLARTTVSFGPVKLKRKGIGRP